MDIAQSARKLASSFEQLEDLDMMEHAKAGESRRAHDFIRVDLPLMIDVAEGRDPTQRDDLSVRQKALLELAPGDMADRINSDMQSARRLLGWSAPYTNKETKDFIFDSDSYTHELRNALFAVQENRPEPDLTQNYTNSAENPIPADKFEAIRAQEIHMGYFVPGDEVIVTAGLQDTQNPYTDGKKAKIAEIKLSQYEKDSALYTSTFRLDGEDEFRKRTDMIDPRGTQHAYGVIAQAEGRLYYVAIESTQGKIPEDQMVAREITGIESMMAKRINRAAELNEQEGSLVREMRATPSIDENVSFGSDGHPNIQPVNTMRNALAMDDPQSRPEPIAGEFAFHPVDGPNDKVGPIVIEASSWQSSADPEELGHAIGAISNYLRKHEYAQISNRNLFADIDAGHKGAEIQYGQDNQETSHRKNVNQQAMVAAAHQQGM